MRKRPRPDQIAAILRDFQADLDAGLNINHACRKAGIGPTTYYRWKALQEDPISNEQLRISELESEVGRLKLLVAELAHRPPHAPGGLEKKAMTAPRRRLIVKELREQFHVSQRRASRRWIWPAPASATRPSFAMNRRRWLDGSRNWPGRTRGTATGGSGPSWIARAGRSTRRRFVASGVSRG